MHRLRRDDSPPESPMPSLGLGAGPVSTPAQNPPSNPAPTPPSGGGSKRRLEHLIIPGSILLIGMVGTLLLWWGAVVQVRSKEMLEFERLVDNQFAELGLRFQRYSDALQGAKGLFAVKDIVREEDWRAYIDDLIVNRSLPGAMGIGYISYVERKGLKNFVSAARADGDPEFTVKTTGYEKDLFIVTYLEPSARNSTAIGYDIGSRQEGRDAAERSLLTGNPVISGKLTLSQGNTQFPGVLYLVPIFNTGQIIDTEETRREAIRGWVYVPINIANLMHDGRDKTDSRLSVHIFDGVKPSKETILYGEEILARGSDGDDADQSQGSSGTDYWATRHLKVGGRTLAIVFRPHPDFVDGSGERAVPWLALATGSTFTVFLFWIFLKLSSAREFALTTAQTSTDELSETRERAGASEARFRAMNDALHLGMFLTDTAGDFIYTNQAYERITGMPSDKSLGKGWNRAVHPKDRERILTEWTATAQREDFYFESVHRFLRPDNTVAWASVKAAAMRDEHSFWGYAGTVEDITERKQSEEIQQEQAKHIVSLLGATIEGIYGVDPNGRCTFINKSGAKMLGYQPGDLIGKDLHEMIHQNRAEVVKGSVESCLVCKASQRTDGCRVEGIVLWRQDGGSVTTEYSATPIMDSGVVKGVIVAFTDLSDRKRIHDEFRRLKNAACRTAVVLTRVNEQLEELVAYADQLAIAAESAPTEGFPESVSGSLRDARFTNSSLRDKNNQPNGQPELHNRLKEVKFRCEALLGVMDEVLDYSLMEAGQAGLEVVDFCLREIFEDTLKPFSFHAREKGLRLSLTISQDVPQYLLGDPVRVRQVISNLVHNAIKFTERGDVAVRVTRESSSSAHTSLHITVSDTGKGITKERQKNIFEPYNQAELKTAHPEVGIGLGLAICTRVLALMGGKIWVESSAGEGSQFHCIAQFGNSSHVEVKREVREPVIEIAEPPVVAAARPLRVLLAGSDAVNQRLTLRILEKRSHSVTIVENGRDAMRLLDNEFFDVLLLDVQVLQMAALQTTAAIRQLQRNATTYLPIVGITTYKVEGEQCVASGMDAYITKPVRANTLIELLERLALPKEEPTNPPIADVEGLTSSPPPASNSTTTSNIRPQINIRIKGGLGQNLNPNGGSGLR